MREIKFRAWDIKNKVMRYDDTHFSNAGTVTINFMKDGYDDMLVVGETAKLMQFTGLLDINGKEIYEGDIVKVKVWDGNKHIREKYHIVWQKDRMRFGLVALGDINLSDSWAFTPSNDFEVIGNIYSNPELIKEGE